MNTPTTPRTRHPLALRLQCRQEWVSGQGTLAEVAKRHGVPPQTLIAWYRRENWSAVRKRWIDKQWSTNDTPSLARENAPQAGNADDARACAIQRLATQLESLDNFIDSAKSADDWHKFTTARQRLFEQWRILSGIPLPGSKRPPKDMKPAWRPPSGPVYDP